MNPVISLISSMLVSKVVVDGLTFPDTEEYDELTPHIRELEAWAHLFGELDISKPMSWLSTCRQVIHQARRNPVDTPMKRDLLSELISRLEYTDLNMSWPLLSLFWEAVAQCPQELVTKSETYELRKIWFSDEMFILAKVPYTKVVHQEDDMHEYKPKSSFKTYVYYIPQSHHPHHDLFLTLLGDIIYSKRKIWSMDYNREKDRPKITALNLPSRRYKGDALEFVDQWQQCLEHGMRRCILLHGPPGTGKSTLARTTALDLDRRTLVVSARAFTHIQAYSWREILTVVNPEVVILDDIDRVDNLYRRLDRFEDAYYKVPLTLFTSNDLDEIPSAMLRPGRIDQIIELSDPDPEIRYEVLASMAQEEGIEDIPVHRRPFLMALYDHYTGAFLVEYLRRIKIFGWDYRLPKGDLTFAEFVGKEDEYDTRNQPKSASSCLWLTTPPLHMSSTKKASL